MKKNKILFLSSVFFSLLLHNYINCYSHTFIKLEHWAIKATDGLNPGMNGDACLDCLQVRATLNKLLRDPSGGGTVNWYPYGQEKKTLHDLYIMEHEETLNNPLDKHHFNQALKAAKKDFITFTEPLLGEAEMARQTTMHLVKEWCEKAGRNDSLMLSWGEVDEKKILDRASAAEFRQFCLDLKNFLHDLMFNCPKGREQFKQERLSTIALKDAFAKLTSKAGSVFEDVFNSVVKESEQTNRNKENARNYGTENEAVDHLKKMKFSKGVLSDEVWEALSRVAPEVNAEEFEALFRQFYQLRCDKFDASFVAK